MQASGIGRDVNQRGLAQLRQAELLTFDDGLVLQERGGNLSEKLFRRRRFILPKTVRCRPEVEAGGVGLRGQPMEQPELQRAAAGVAFAVGARSAAPVHCRIEPGAMNSKRWQRSMRP